MKQELLSPQAQTSKIVYPIHMKQTWLSSRDPHLEKLFWHKFGHTTWNVYSIFTLTFYLTLFLAYILTFSAALCLASTLTYFLTYFLILSRRSIWHPFWRYFVAYIQTFFLAPLSDTYLQKFFLVEVRQGPPWSGACCSGPATTSGITSFKLRSRPRWCRWPR